MYIREIVTLDVMRQTISANGREKRITPRQTYILRAMAFCFPGYLSNAIIRDIHYEESLNPARKRTDGSGAYNSQMSHLRRALGRVLRMHPVDTMAAVLGRYPGQRLLYPVRVIEIDGVIVEPPDSGYCLLPPTQPPPRTDRTIHALLQESPCL